MLSVTEAYASVYTSINRKIGENSQLWREIHFIDVKEQEARYPLYLSYN
jgi:hypothetical protein